LANFKYQSGDQMSALQVYLVHKNRYRAIFGSPALSLDSAQDRQALADSIDSELSPENLTCDGELPRESVASRYRTLTTVARELQKLDPAVKFYEHDGV
jgi:hypothetical protein